jgi:hypothetical protein
MHKYDLKASLQLISECNDQLKEIKGQDIPRFFVGSQQCWAGIPGVLGTTQFSLHYPQLKTFGYHFK